MKHRKTILLIASMAGIVFFLTMYHLASAPVRKLRAWQGEANLELSEQPIQFVKGLDSVQRQIAFRKALLDLPKKDSIHLVLNLPDSALSLLINGLPVYQVHLSKIELDPILLRLNEDVYWSQFSKSIQVDTSRATIVKEPIIEKVAPKTQEEFLASVTMPDSVAYDPVFIQFSLKNGVDLILGQNELSDRAVRKLKRQFSAVQDRKQLKSLLTSVFTFKSLEYRPSIELEASGAELTSIYRALPVQPKVVIIYH